MKTNIVLLMLLFVGICSMNASKNPNSGDTRPSVVFIFKKNPLNNQLKKNKFYTANNLRFYDSNLTRDDRYIKNNFKDDTIKITSDQETLPVDLFYNYVTYNYFVSAGDTIMFTFKNDTPIASSKHTKSSFIGLNYSLTNKKRFGKPLKASNILTLSQDKDLPIKRYEKLVNQYEIEHQYLDSLVKTNDLTEELRSRYDLLNIYKVAGVLLSAFKDQNFTKDFFERHPLSDLVNNRDLLYDDFYHEFIIWRYLWGVDLNIKKIKSTAGVDLDYVMAYEKILLSPIDKEVKDYLLFYCLQMIQETQSKVLSTKYAARFKVDVQNPRYKLFVLDNFDSIKSYPKGNTLLINSNAQKATEFDEILKKYKGNVIYVDFWASWCLPCRAAMPASAKLRLKLENSTVKFIYISIDSKIPNWKSASTEENLTNYDGNFWLTNPKESQLVKQISLTTIPRYLIYNKNGKIVYKNAPSPDSESIQSMLSNLANEP